MFTLTALPLRFTCEALTPIRLNGYSAGSNLRGALGNVMRRAYCGHTLTPGPSPVGKASTGEGNGCPVCWLLAANEHPGEERRGYALVPPPRSSHVKTGEEDREGVYAPGRRFEFGLTLFGEAQRYLPYFILAVPEMGRNGVGPGRGQFALRSVMALDPLAGNDQIVLAEGESLVRVPDRLITAERVQQAADRYGAVDRLRLTFRTPMRLIDEGRLVKTPDFGVLFQRLLERLDDLNIQHGSGAPRAPAEVQALQTLANQVRLVDAHTDWIELKSGSTRSGRVTWLSGFVGAAEYDAPREVWEALLPWLLWGTIAQAGKDVVKGNGVFEIAAMARDAQPFPLSQHEIVSPPPARPALTT